MKTLILTLAFLASIPAFAARDIVSLDCVSRARSFAELTLEVKSMWTSDDKMEGVLRDVTMTMKAGGKLETGRAHTVDSDKNYKPRKYKDTLRFDMSQMTDTKDFSKYYPDGCSVNVMIPNDVVTSNVSRIEVPVVMQCDQSGGSQTLDCQVGTVR